LNEEKMQRSYTKKEENIDQYNSLSSEEILIDYEDDALEYKR
jgi:hypothetical protein